MSYTLANIDTIAADGIAIIAVKKSTHISERPIKEVSAHTISGTAISLTAATRYTFGVKNICDAVRLANSAPVMIMVIGVHMLER